MDDRRRAVPEAAPAGRPRTGRRELSTRRSWASRCPGRERQWRIAGLPVVCARRGCGGGSSAGLDGENTRSVVETGLADGRRPAGRPARATIWPSRSSSTSAASCGWTPTADVEPRDAAGERDARCRRRDVPAGHEEPLDTGRPGRRDDRVDVRREAVGLEVAVGSRRRTHSAVGRREASSVGAGAERRRRGHAAPRSRGAGRAAPACRAARLAGVGAPGELVEQRRAAVAVRGVRVGMAELGQDLRRDAGMNGATARPSAGRPR